MKLSENTILITGATSGIGYALANRLASLGNTIIAVGRNQLVLNELAAQSPHIHPIASDLANVELVDKLATQVKQQFPRLNVLINNAGIQYNYPFAEGAMHLPEITHEVTVNLLAPLWLSSLLLPTLLAQPEAALVNISSGLGLVPKQSAPVYCGTKGGLHLFTKALGYQLARTSVHVMEVIPPLVDTPMTAGRGRNKISPDQFVDEFLRGFARNRREINVGKVGLLRLIQRVSPALADTILKNS